jgi:hypothetical protein
MLSFLETLPPGTYISVEAMRHWLDAGKTPAKGGILRVSASDQLSADEYRRWMASLPSCGVEVVETPALDLRQR